MTITTVGYDLNPTTLLGVFCPLTRVCTEAVQAEMIKEEYLQLWNCRKTNRWILRTLRGLHPHLAHPHRCQQLRPVLQEQTLEERGQF